MRPRRLPMSRSVVRSALTCLLLFTLGFVAATAVVLVVPTNFGLWALYPFVQLTALPLIWIVALLLSAGLAFLLCRYTSQRGGTRRRAPRILALVLVGSFLIEMAMFARAGGFLSAHRATVEGDPSDLTVLSFNARDTDPSEISRAAIAGEADALLLVEITLDVAADVSHQLHRQGVDNQLFTGTGTSARGVDGTAVIAAQRLGQYREVPSAPLVFGSVSAAPIEPQDIGGQTPPLTAPRLSAVHPPPPVPGKFPSAIWKQQVYTAVRICSRERGSIVGGDFNAATAHIALSTDESCLDASAYLGRGAVGTWPATVPSPFGASIDHQLTDRRAWEPTGIRFMKIGESDHRALLVTYRSADS
jgi:endonuclease/exonuclease/phosphatase (EEP) superfamily protein YafD